MCCLLRSVKWYMFYDTCSFLCFKKAKSSTRKAKLLKNKSMTVCRALHTLLDNQVIFSFDFWKLLICLEKKVQLSPAKRRTRSLAFINYMSFCKHIENNVHVNLVIERLNCVRYNHTCTFICTCISTIEKHCLRIAYR